ncbi:MAG: SMI1/KNR4 family protein [Alphaproteobacteria bacterium]|nr:SMI1/KNR4 family protein [Alphaproteobacteria bacterium]
MAGYTQSELDDIQAKWGLRFPPDLVALYRQRRKVIETPGFDSFDWLAADDATVRDALDWPLGGFFFDVGHGLWWPEWGPMPEENSAREARLREIFAQAPKLIPVCGHRYIPETPHEAGNPVFSVYQMDVIVYGADLADYIVHENTVGPRIFETPPAKMIPFWSRAVEFNNQRFASGVGFACHNRNDVFP